VVHEDMNKVLFRDTLSSDLFYFFGVAWCYSVGKICFHVLCLGWVFTISHTLFFPLLFVGLGGGSVDSCFGCFFIRVDYC